MNIANTAQAEHWNTGEGVAHWIGNPAGIIECGSAVGKWRGSGAQVPRNQRAGRLSYCNVRPTS